MALVIVERTFETPIDFEALHALQDRGAWCLDLHKVTFLCTYLSIDRRRMVCVYEAPDAEAVRTAQRQLGIPFDRAWTGTRLP